MTLSSLINARWFRPVALTSGGLVLLLLVLWLGPRLVDLESSRGAIVTQIEKQLDRRVALGRLSLRLLPRIEVRADEVRIAEDPAFGSGDFVLARVVRLRVGLWSLLRGRPELRGLELDSPQIVLIRRPNGSEPDWNWRSLRPLREPAKTQDSGPLDLVVRDGRFTLIDRLVDPPVESTYSGIDVTLDRFSPKEQFTVLLAVTMPTQNGQPGGRLELQGRVGPLASGDPLATPIEARLRLERVGVAALEALAGEAPSGRAGRLTVDVELNGRLNSQLRARGTMRAEELRLVADEAIAPSTTPLELKFELTAASQNSSQNSGKQINLQIEQAEIVLGATRLVTTGTIGLPAAVDASPIYDLSLNGQGINLESLLESAYAFGFGPPPGTKAAGQADLAMRIRNGDSAPPPSPPARPVLEGQLALRGLRFESRELTQPIEVSALNMEATPQALKFSPFRTALGSSTALEISRLELKDYRTAPLLELAAATNAARLDDLLRIAESFGLRPDLKGTGMVNLRIALVAALTPDPRVVSLTGAGKLSQASLETPRLTRPLSVANVDLNFTGDAAQFENLALSLASSSLTGSLRVANFARPQIGFDLWIDQLAVPEISSILRDPPGGAGKSTINDLTADGRLAIGQLKLDGLTAEKVDSKITLRKGLLTLDPLSLSIYGGVWRGAIRLDQTDIALKGQIAGVDVNQLLSRPGKSSPLFGRLDGRLDLRGRNKGGDAGDLISSLIGNGQVSITDGQIASFDLLKRGETIGRLVNLPTGGAATAFRQIRTNLRFDPGVLRTDALQIVMTDLTASGEGTIRFGEPGSVDYAILARLSPALTRRILSSRAGRANRAGTADDPAALATGESPAETTSGGTGVSQLFSSFFTEKDSLVIPLKISGPVNGPRFSLDAETLRRRATSSIFENLQQKILGPKGPATPEKPATADEPRKPSPEEAIRGILDRLKKKKPGEQP
ncbi:MAG: AsmA family protein [Acidobacteriota bacterium]